MDEAKLQEFMGKLVNDMGGAAMLATVMLSRGRFADCQNSASW
jgi:hypothetical protein